MSLSDMTIEDDFLVAGNPFEPISPNFKLREFMTADGEVKVHRDLITALQVLRDQFGKKIHIRRVEAMPGSEVGEYGRYAWIVGDPLIGLNALAQMLREQHYFETAKLEGDTLLVKISESDQPVPIGSAAAIELAVQVVAGFDSDEDPFRQVLGNRDGAGLSFGPSRVNFRAGTLPALFKKFLVTNGPAIEDCFGPHFQEWLHILDQPKADQIAWADQISTGPKKADLVDPWRGYFQSVGRILEFRLIMTEAVREEHGDKLGKALKQLKQIKNIRIDHLACFCALYEICMQEGSLNKALEPIRKRVKLERPANQFDLVRIAVEERAKKAGKSARAETVSRALGILNRRATEGTVDGKSVTRDNSRFYLLRNARVEDIDDLIE